MASETTKAGSATRVTVMPSGKALGAEVHGVDLRAVNAEDFAEIHRAWLDHSVLLFRGQKLTDEELITFSKKFGDLDWAPVQETGRRFVEGHPEIYVVSNVMENGAPIGSLGAGEATWHTDMSYLPDPPKASILYALEVPPSGGNTYFCSMHRAYEILPDALKKRVEGKSLKHDGAYNSGGYLRQGVTAVDDPVSSPGTFHPLVRRHTETGGAACTWAAGATPTLADSRCRSRKRCSMSCGPTWTAQRLPGTTNGRWATWSFGIIAAPCIAVIPLTPARVE